MQSPLLLQRPLRLQLAGFEREGEGPEEAAVRSRVFAAIYKASKTVSIEDEDYIAVAQHISRADHNGLMKLAKLLDWPKELFAWDGKRN